MSDSPRAIGGTIVFRSLSFRLVALSVAIVSACDPGSTLPEAKKPQPTYATGTACTANQMRVGSECFALAQIKLNTVGYVVGRGKRATVPAVDGVETFNVVAADTGEVAFSGALAAATVNADTADTTRLADFTALDVPGNYVLQVEGLTPSPVFRIGADALNDALRVTMLGLYGQRCGVPITIVHQGSTFSHAACHAHDALRDPSVSKGDIVGTEVDGSGGWHDAGDYGKYTVNAAFSVAFILKAWEDFGDKLATLQHIPSYEGTLPPLLAEAKFQLDQIFKMQLPSGGTSHMIGPWASPGPAAFPGMVRPETDPTIRAFSDVGTAATADLVAVAAMAARVFAPIDPAYANQCLAAAQLGEAYLDQNPTGAAVPSLTNFTHNAYGTQDSDDRFWAKVELWRTTADPTLLAQVEGSLKGSVTINFDWSNVENLGMFSYVQAKSDARDPARLTAAQDAIVSSAKTLTANANNHAYGRGIDRLYYWGSNGVVARSAINLFVANSIAPNAAFLDAAVQQIDFLLGRNAFGRSFVTGLGYLPALHPHHRPSEGDAVQMPWPGLLVGGPNSGKDDDPVKAQQPAGLAPGLVWFDESGSYGTNEVAINWNAALAYALAGFYQ